MSETRKVVVDGVEFEVELEGEGTCMDGNGRGPDLFQIEIPDAAPCVERRSAREAARRRSPAPFRRTFPARS